MSLILAIPFSVWAAILFLAVTAFFAVLMIHPVLTGELRDEIADYESDFKNVEPPTRSRLVPYRG